MAVRIWENKESQALTGGDNEQDVRQWEIRQCPNQAAAANLGLSFAPMAVMHPISAQVLLRKSWSLDPKGAADSGAWLLTITYAPDGGSEDSPPENMLTFDASAETQHITQSLTTVSQNVPTGRTAANFKGAIGVEKDDVKGVDIVQPRLSFGWNVYKPKELVTTAFVRQLGTLVGCVNKTPFIGFAAGEVMFIGASGSRRTGEKNWEINYKFDFSPTVNGIVVGDITIATKEGWDYLWVSYELGTDNDADIVIAKPQQANVERVYRRVDFAPLGIV